VLTNFAAGTLIVLGVLLAVLGILAGNGNVTFTLIGLGSVAAGGVLRAAAPRPAM
jgi:hypothetical protein